MTQIQEKPKYEINEQQAMSALRRFWRSDGQDDDAQFTVATYCYRRFAHQIRHYSSIDPTYSNEDIRSIFMNGIIDGIVKAKRIGNPLYFIGQQGVYAVKGSLQMRKMLLHGEYFEDAAYFGSTNPYQDIDDRIDAEQRVETLLGEANLSERQREIVDMQLDGRCDLTEDGGNRDLAKALDISAQRVSTLVNRIGVRMIEAETTIR